MSPDEFYVHAMRTAPDDRACEMGLLIVRIAQAIESLPHIARAERLDLPAAAAPVWRQRAQRTRAPHL